MASTMPLSGAYRAEGVRPSKSVGRCRMLAASAIHSLRCDASALSCKLLPSQQIANLRQERLLTAQHFGLLGLFVPQLIDDFDEEEQRCGDDREVDDDSDKVAPCKHRALLAGFRQAVGRYAAGQADEVVGEIESAG